MLKALPFHVLFSWAVKSTILAGRSAPLFLQNNERKLLCLVEYILLDELRGAAEIVVRQELQKWVVKLSLLSFSPLSRKVRVEVLFSRKSGMAGGNI